MKIYLASRFSRASEMQKVKIDLEKRTSYLTEQAPTIALLGYIAEDAYISPRLGQYGHKIAKEELEEEQK